MPKEELVEGIKQALSRGESLEKAMTTFYNSGYKKEDIEEAAAAAQAPVFQQGFQQPVMGSQAKPLVPQQPKIIQRVSAYGSKPPSKTGMAITIILIVVLLFLIGILAAIILFKDEISNLFSFWKALF